MRTEPTARDCVGVSAGVAVAGGGVAVVNSAATIICAVDVGVGVTISSRLVGSGVGVPVGTAVAVAIEVAVSVGVTTSVDVGLGCSGLASAAGTPGVIVGVRGTAVGVGATLRVGVGSTLRVGVAGERVAVGVQVGNGVLVGLGEGDGVA
jgi:hypothetical protein